MRLKNYQPNKRTCRCYMKNNIPHDTFFFWQMRKRCKTMKRKKNDSTIKPNVTNNKQMNIPHPNEFPHNVRARKKQTNVNVSLFLYVGGKKDKLFTFLFFFFVFFFFIEVNWNYTNSNVQCVIISRLLLSNDI